MTQLGYGVLDISDNESGQAAHPLHGGRPRPALADEVILRFEFPERPGARSKFLEAVGTDWNITLFHYRNHGADYGRVLAGLQVPAADRQRFVRQLRSLGYPYEEETENPAFRMFLA